MYEVDPGLEPEEWMLVSAGQHSIPFTLLVEVVSISLKSDAVVKDGNDVIDWMMY